MGSEIEVVANRFGLEDGVFVATRAVSDASGNFTFRAPIGTVDVSVRASGFIETWGHDFDDGEEVAVRLDRRGVVTGIVVSAEDGEPVPGVHIFPSAAGVVTDEHGRFRIEPDRGGYQVIYVRDGGWISRELARSVRIPIRSGESAEVTLTVIRAARVEGIVVDAEGEPMPGIVVTAFDEDAGDSHYQDRSSVAAGPDGRFVFENLIPGVVYGFHARWHGQRAGADGPIRGESGKTGQVRIELPVPLTRSVLVLDAATGQPVVAARVGVGYQPRPGLTDASGRVRVHLEEDREYVVKAKHPDYCPGEQRVEEVTGTDDIVVRLRPGLNLSGTVLFPDGTPAEAAQIQVRCGEESRRYFGVGRGGVFRLTGLASGGPGMARRP